jgi:hypothetical protein
LRIIEFSDRAPLFAPRQHGGEQVDQARRIVVHPGQHHGHGLGMRGIGVNVIEMVEGAPRCFAVMAAGILHRRRLGAEARQQGHLPRQAGAQGIDGGEAQTPRLLLDGPVALCRTRQRGQGQIEGHALVLRLGRHAGACTRQAFGDAAAHLARRLVGEGDGDDLFGLVGNRQQAQVALCQQFGLAGTGRRLDDEGIEIQRPPPVVLVFAQQFAHGKASRSSSTCRSASRSKGKTSQ